MIGQGAPLPEYQPDVMSAVLQTLSGQ